MKMIYSIISWITSRKRRELSLLSLRASKTNHLGLNKHRVVYKGYNQLSLRLSAMHGLKRRNWTILRMSELTIMLMMLDLKRVVLLRVSQRKEKHYSVSAVEVHPQINPSHVQKRLIETTNQMKTMMMLSIRNLLVVVCVLDLKNGH